MLEDPIERLFHNSVMSYKSKQLNLLIPCPNGADRFGENQEKYILNPSKQVPLAQFEFFGKLIGISIRTKNLMELDLPSIILKPLVHSNAEFSDLEMVDQATAQYLKSLRETLELQGVNKQSFNDIFFEAFTTRSSSGEVVLLTEGGEFISVTWDNRSEYADLVEKYRLHEFKTQLDAILKGIYAILPQNILNIFTWGELESRVCGTRGIDIELLKIHTVYRGCTLLDRHIQFFWQVLESWSTEKRQMFIRFVFGRSRLPPENEFTMPFQIHRFVKDGKPDNYLPEAHTCFFALELPAYSTLEIMQEKLLYAITMCRDIDTDYLVRNDDDQRDNLMFSDDGGDMNCNIQ